MSQEQINSEANPRSENRHHNFDFYKETGIWVEGSINVGAVLVQTPETENTFKQIAVTSVNSESRDGHFNQNTCSHATRSNYNFDTPLSNAVYGLQVEENATVAETLYIGCGERKKPVTSFKNVPSPTPYFTGRTWELDLMQKKLQECQGKPKILVITGSAGVGKTELAKQFAKLGGMDYNGVAWIKADSEETIEKSFRELATILGLEPLNNSNRRMEISELVKDIYYHCDTHIHPALLIFDNASELNSSDSCAHALSAYMPSPELCSNLPDILITSRNSSEWDGTMTVNLEPFNAPNSMDYFGKVFKLPDRLNEKLEQLLKEYVVLCEGNPKKLVEVASHLEYNPSEESVEILERLLQGYLPKLRAKIETLS